MNQGMDGLSRDEICTQKYENIFLRFSPRIWIPNILELKKDIIHPKKEIA